MKINVSDRNEKIIRKNTIITAFPNKHSLTTCITFSIDWNLLVSGSSDGFIGICDFEKVQLLLCSFKLLISFDIAVICTSIVVEEDGKQLDHAFQFGNNLIEEIPEIK